MALAEEAFSRSTAIAQSHTVEDIAAVYAKSLKAVRLTAAACGMVTGPKAINGDPFYFVTWPRSWIELYQARGFIKKDPLPRWALVSGAPVTWGFVRDSLARNDPAHEVLEAAKTWGFTEGLAMPFRSNSGTVGLVSVGGERGPFSPDEVIYIRTLSATTFHRLTELFPDDELKTDLAPFSRRERECLALLYQGFTDKEIARLLGVTFETVRSHLENARLKVGARSRSHLVALTSGLQS